MDLGLIGRMHTGMARVVGVKPAVLTPFRLLLLVIAAGVLLVNFQRSLIDLAQFDAADLRIKIIGARAILAGMNPYRLETPPTCLQDASDVWAGGFYFPYTPPLLFSYALLAPLPFRVGKSIIFALQWSALFLAILALARCHRSERVRVYWIVLAMFWFGGSSFWRLHVERGQWYIFLACGLSVLMWALPRAPSWAAVMLGWLVGIRPSFALVPALLAFARNWRRFAVLSGVAAVVIALVPFAFGRGAYWVDFLNSVRHLGRVTARLEPMYSNPATLEYLSHMPPDLSHTMGELFIFNSSISTLVLLGSRHGIPIPPSAVGLIGTVVVALLAALAFGMSAVRARRRGGGRMGLAFSAIYCATLADFAAPVRQSYLDVMFLPLLGVVLPMLMRGGGRWLGVGVLLTLGYGEWVNLFGPALHDIFRPYLLMLFLGIIFFGVNRRTGQVSRRG